VPSRHVFMEEPVSSPMDLVWKLFVIVIGCCSEELDKLLDFPRLTIPASNYFRAVSRRAVCSAVASAPRCSSATRDFHRMTRVAASSYGLAVQFKHYCKLR
jgi:hypothetical protein